jgi:transposase-like protein
MKTQRKQHNREFKANVAIEAIRGNNTQNEIAKESGIHPIQIAQWKKQALEG